jgi:hypothetical protein
VLENGSEFPDVSGVLSTDETNKSCDGKVFHC